MRIKLFIRKGTEIIDSKYLDVSTDYTNEILALYPNSVVWETDVVTDDLCKAYIVDI